VISAGPDFTGLCQWPPPPAAWPDSQPRFEEFPSRRWSAYRVHRMARRVRGLQWARRSPRESADGREMSSSRPAPPHPQFQMKVHNDHPQAGHVLTPARVAGEMTWPTGRCRKRVISRRQEIADAEGSSSMTMISWAATKSLCSFDTRATTPDHPKPSWQVDSRSDRGIKCSSCTPLSPRHGARNRP